MNNSADASFNDNLIQAIQQYPNLWDKGSADYHDSDMNRNSWESISTTVEKNVDECKTRWRTLRDELINVSNEDAVEKLENRTFVCSCEST